MKKKILSLCLVVAMVATAVVGASMAYLTDDAGEVSNVFSVGNIDISLDEEVGVVGDGGTVTEDDTGATYTGVMPGDYLKKEVTVSNNGKTDAYVAVTVTLNNAAAINAAIDDVYGDGNEGGQAMYDYIFDGWGINQNPRPGKNGGISATGADNARGVIDGTYGLPKYVLKVDFAKTTSVSSLLDATNWFIAGNEVAGQYWVDGNSAEYNGFYTKDMNANEICYTYYIDLPAGKSTTLFEGLNVPAEFDNEQIKMFDGLKINVSAKAIQADNFFSYYEAFEELAGVEALGTYTQVKNSEELAAAIESGKTRIWLNAGTYHMPAAAKGKTLTISGTTESVIEVVPAGQGEANGQLDYNLDGSTVTFNGVTIKTNGQLYAGYARLSGTYNDCVIQNTYNLGTGNSAFYNCEINITNEYLRVGGASTALFDVCTFNTDGRAILVFQDGTSVAQTVTVKDCTFNATAAANTWNGIHVAAVSIDGTNGTYTVNLEGTNTVDSDFNGLWQIKAGEANVTVNE